MRSPLLYTPIANDKRRAFIAAAAALAAAAFAAHSAEKPDAGAQWWPPGAGRTLPASASYDNEHGQLGIPNTAGAIDTRGHPFFEPIGTNGYVRNLPPTG
jgi:hypothetical protein